MRVEILAAFSRAWLTDSNQIGFQIQAVLHHGSDCIQRCCFPSPKSPLLPSFSLCVSAASFPSPPSELSHSPPPLTSTNGNGYLIPLVSATTDLLAWLLSEFKLLTRPGDTHKGLISQCLEPSHISLNMQDTPETQWEKMVSV